MEGPPAPPRGMTAADVGFQMFLLMVMAHKLGADKTPLRIYKTDRDALQVLFGNGTETTFNVAPGEDATGKYFEIRLAAMPSAAPPAHEQAALDASRVITEGG